MFSRVSIYLKDKHIFTFEDLCNAVKEVLGGWSFVKHAVKLDFLLTSEILFTACLFLLTNWKVLPDLDISGCELLQTKMELRITNA